MKTLLFTLSFLFSAFVIHAQTTLQIWEYLDEKCNKTDSANAAYYRTVEENGEGIIVRDFYITGELEMEAMCSSITPKMVKEGKCTNYYKNGKVLEEGTYHVNSRKGLFKEYYESGRPKSEISYEDNKQIHIQHWTETGEPLLINGNGLVKQRYGNKPTTNFSLISNSVLVNSYSVADGSTDTIYTFLEKLPEYKGGHEALAKDLKENVIYPKSARRNGIEGTVYVQFVIDKEGKVTEPIVLRGIEEECDEIARIAVGKLKPWNPGLVNKKPVFVRYVLPVKFRLK